MDNYRGPQDGPVLVQIPFNDGSSSRGILTTPPDAGGLVVFAQWAASSPHSGGDMALARELNEDGCATLLLPLHLADELAHVTTTFDVELAARRIAHTCDLIRRRPDTAMLPLGLHGSGIGAAATLELAATAPSMFAAVVTRSGRPDLTTAPLANVSAPTLLIVGEHDEVVLDHNLLAFCDLAGERHVELVPDATDLAREPGARAYADDLTRDWFRTHLLQARNGSREVVGAGRS